MVGPKAGFETLLGPLPRLLHMIYAKALDAEGHVIGTTEAMETFVPSELHDNCDDLWCNAMVMVDVEESVIGINLDPYKWLYPAIILYGAVALCLAAVTVRHCMWRRRLSLLCAKCSRDCPGAKYLGNRLVCLPIRTWGAAARF